MALGHASRAAAVGDDQVEVARADAERARTETRVLVRLAQVTSGNDEPEDVYEPAFDAARELFGTERSAILLFDDSDRTRFHAWRGLSDAYRAAVEGHSPWHRAQSDARPILIYDVTADETLAEYRPVFAAEHIRAIGMVPLIARRQLLGKLMLYWDRPRAFSAHDEALALAIASQVAEALERARLHQMERRSFEAERVARARAEAAEAKLRLALGAGRMGVWEWSIPTGRVSWSPTLEAIHGLAPGTFPGTFDAYQRDVHPDDSNDLVQRVRTTLETLCEHHVEYRIVLPDGQVRWVAGHGNVVAVADGQPISMIGVCMDITERKQTEQARAAATAELEQTLRDNELFASILAHDLRNPLAAILTAVQLLAGQPENADERAQAPLRHVLATGGRMTRLVDQLLDFTRARVGSAFKLVPRPADLSGLCDQVVGELEGAHPDWKLRLEARGDCVGVWDPDRLLQVVSNLVANAGQHGATGTDIVVTLDGTDRDGVAMSIHNHGSIPEALLPKLFIPFGNVREGRAGGLGLGLFISKQIVAAHGGRTEVSSSDARGTTVAVWLPRDTRRPERP